MSTTIKEIARILGISASTVSRSINDKPGIRSETRARVKELASKLDYQPSELARSLVRQQTNALGLLVGGLSHPLYAEIVELAERQARDRGYMLIVCSEPDRPQSRIQEMRRRGIDGLLIIPVFDSQQLSNISKVVPDRLPVTVFSNIENLNVDFVTVDRCEGTYEAVKYLHGLGHRSIGYLCLPDFFVSTYTRLRGFERAVAELGFTVKPHWIMGDWAKREEGYRNMKELIATGDFPTAIFAHNDFSAIGAMKAIREAGMKVPDDISIIGADNLVEGSYLDVPLTTLDEPRDEIARLLVTTIIERIKDPERPLQQIVLKADLVIRDSCAAPPNR